MNGKRRGTGRRGAGVILLVVIVSCGGVGVACGGGGKLYLRPERQLECVQ